MRLVLFPTVPLVLAATLSITTPSAVRAQTDAGIDPACPLPAPTYRAEDFNDSVGINAPLFDGYISEGLFAGAGVKDPAAAKVDPAIKSTPWVSYTAIFTDYRHAKPFDGFEFGNIYSYQNFGVPSSSLLSNAVNFSNTYPVGTVIKPFVPTECGYSVPATGGEEKQAQLRVQARRLTMLPL